MSNEVALNVQLDSDPLRWSWMVCLSAGLFFFYDFFQLNIFDVINQPLRDEFHLDATLLSWMSSGFLWADILFLLPAGYILDHFSTKKIIITAMCVCIIGTLGFALTHSFAWAVFFHSISGIGNAFCFLSLVILVSRWFPPRKQALVIGCLVTMAFIGGMTAHAPFAYLNDHYGWRNALLIDAAIGTMILIWIQFIVEDKPKKVMFSKREKDAVPPSVIKAICNSQNWLAGFYTSCLNLPIMVICALWGVSYLQVVHHLSAIAASHVVSFIYIGSIIGCPLVGWLSDKQGKRKPLMIFGAIASLLSIAPLIFSIYLSQMLLSILFLLLGVFTSAQVVTYPLISESNHSSNTGIATAIASVIIMGGAGVAQVMFGWLMQFHAGKAITQYTIADYQFAVWMFPVTIIAGLLAILFVKETYCR